MINFRSQRQLVWTRHPSGDTPPVAISLPERCPVCVGDGAAEPAYVIQKTYFCNNSLMHSK